jgi:hypothetical protein
MSNKRIIIIGGGTVFHIRNHLALCAPAYGGTARMLNWMCQKRFNNDNGDGVNHDKIIDVDLYKTKMAGGATFNMANKEFERLNPGQKMPVGWKPTQLETNEDIDKLLQTLVKDDKTKIIFMTAAMCDFTGQIGDISSGKYSERLKTSEGSCIINLEPAEKIVSKIRKTRKDIFLVAFKTTTGFTEDQQYLAGLDLCKRASCNLVLANDTITRVNMIVTPEEARYCVTTDREKALKELVDITWHRSHLTFTRSTVIASDPISWDSDLVPDSLRTVVDYCIAQNAYKPFNGVTAGHFAVKLNNNTFLTSIRKTDFNEMKRIGLVKVVTDGPDTVLAYGAKPSVGGQSQRIVFNDHPGMDCILHFHCPLKEGSTVPIVSQREVECGSHQCGINTSKGLKDFGKFKAVYLDNHGPNIVFHHSIDPNEVIEFIEDNFDLTQKTGGFVSVENNN